MEIQRELREEDSNLNRFPSEHECGIQGQQNAKELGTQVSKLDLAQALKVQSIFSLEDSCIDPYTHQLTLCFFFSLWVLQIIYSFEENSHLLERTSNVVMFHTLQNFDRSV
jgi:hypothetical protein